MTRRISRIQVAIGLEGLALLRDYPSIDEQELRTRLEEIDRLRGHLADPANVLVVRDVDTGSGYEAWASTYDEDARTANPLISVEEPVVQSLLDACPPGLALDAACGTGRHAANLIRRGHRVTGLDSSPEMLAVAARNVQGARLVTGSLQALPVASDRFDLAVCSLALGHSPDIAPAIAELGRVVKAGGRVVVSDLHPVSVLLGGRPIVPTESGESLVIREHFHPHAMYLAAFASAGLVVEGCHEPLFTEREVELMREPLRDAFRRAAVGLPLALIWDLVRAE